jgi:hypothetical protein
VGETSENYNTQTANRGDHRSNVGKENMQLGMYRARSMSQVNTNKATVSILISTEEATEITNFKASARQRIDKANVHKVESSVSVALTIFYQIKDELGNSSELTTWLKTKQELL